MLYHARKLKACRGSGMLKQVVIWLTPMEYTNVVLNILHDRTTMKDMVGSIMQKGYEEDGMSMSNSLL